VAATLKSIDYNVAMTLILNNNNPYPEPDQKRITSRGSALAHIQLPMFVERIVNYDAHRTTDGMNDRSH